MKCVSIFFAILGILLTARNTLAHNYMTIIDTHHFIVLMPARTASISEGREAIDGLEFPLKYGIISVYLEDNKFIFTKTANIESIELDKELRDFERDSAIPFYMHFKPPTLIPLRHKNFATALAAWADENSVLLSPVSSGQEIPVDVVPRFKRMCRYAADKEPPIDCALKLEDVEDLYIPFTWEERKQIEQEYAQKADHSCEQK